MKHITLAWNNAITEWQSWLKVAGRAESTVKLRGSQVRRLGRAFPHLTPWELDNETLVRWIATQNWDSDTLRGHRAAFRSFYAWARATGRCDTDPAAGLPPSRAKTVRPRPAPDGVVQDALNHAGERERVMIMCAAFAGMRACEIARIHESDIFVDVDGWSLIAHGKGQKDRVIPLTQDLALVLKRYCHEHGGYAFPGRIDGHLSPKRVSELLSEVLGDSWTGHTLRHRFASRAYAETRDIRAVQELLGHASATTTQRYAAVPDGAMRRAAFGASTLRPSVVGGTPRPARPPHGHPPPPHRQELMPAEVA
ncbi:tyrosine-type recombinase/integrase [Nesterenkonia sp. CL21]|uniref:tyrosine-type recombinase/integrase n=1 Tax=Nesterenkonia sp. CL21 TaxID=3064894 RepID=UPI002878F948|nr:tyrosine-type recombinase/integrase [Nesterenkonia sp. CL21]MDS2172540.1 tyrosine-type recombinase/integrase [Nesterenkonia sp. CL21]